MVSKATCGEELVCERCAVLAAVLIHPNRMIVLYVSAGQSNRGVKG